MVIQHVACSCCKQKTSEKYLANRISFFRPKKLHFFTQFKHCHQNLIIKQPVKFGMKNKSFVLMACVSAEQFRKSGT